MLVLWFSFSSDEERQNDPDVDLVYLHRRTGTMRLGGGGALFARKNYAVPHCLIVEISYLLPQNVRKNMRLQSLKGIKLYVIETQFLEPHILYVGLLDVVTIE